MYEREGTATQNKSRKFQFFFINANRGRQVI